MTSSGTPTQGTDYSLAVDLGTSSSLPPWPGVTR